MWKAVVLKGNQASSGGGQVMHEKVIATDANKDAAVKKAKDMCAEWEKTDMTNNSCYFLDVYEEEPDAKPDSPSQSKTPSRKWIEDGVTKTTSVLVIGQGFTPQSLLFKIGVDKAIITILDAYDRDRGDVKKFLETVGHELSDKKLKEWIEKPEESFWRSDPGKAVGQFKDNWNRSDLGKIFKW